MALIHRIIEEIDNLSGNSLLVDVHLMVLPQRKCYLYKLLHEPKGYKEPFLEGYLIGDLCI